MVTGIMKAAFITKSMSEVSSASPQATSSKCSMHGVLTKHITNLPGTSLHGACLAFLGSRQAQPNVVSHDQMYRHPLLLLTKTTRMIAQALVSSFLSRQSTANH